MVIYIYIYIYIYAYIHRIKTQILIYKNMQIHMCTYIEYICLSAGNETLKTKDWAAGNTKLGCGTEAVELEEPGAH